MRWLEPNLYSLGLQLRQNKSSEALKHKDSEFVKS